MDHDSQLARRVALEDAWSPSAHSDVCCLIYATQNGWKLPILFEEMGVPYDWALVDFDKSEQKSERFLTINPNGRIPALIDRERGVTVAESGAILEYAAGRYASPLLPSPDDELPLHVQVKQWLYWQVSGLGPSMGQAMYFQRLAKVRGHEDAFAIGRFVAEAERCLAMLDAQLQTSGGPFILGERITLVDVACFPYCASAHWATADVSEMRHLRAWIEMLHERPSFRIGVTIPFARPAFFGPPHATPSEIDAEIARNAGQFEIVAGDVTPKASDRLAEAARVREAVVDATLSAYEEAGLRGLCTEGRLEYAIDRARTIDLGAVIERPAAGAPSRRR